MGSLLKAIHVSHVDFWSLDVEGGEMDALKGMDWSIPVSVLLIEVYPRFKRRVGEYLTSHKMRKFSNFHSPTNLNELWYNPDRVSPECE